jgi:hypothetical protein
VADRCPRCLPDSLREAATAFGALTFRPDIAAGTWIGDDLHCYDDRLSVLTVDVDDTPENWEWIRHFTSHLLQRFEQLEIYVTSYPIVVV